ncbi:MAG: PilZ domain-containing protein [Thermodesulfovibrionales bacterium]
MKKIIITQDIKTLIDREGNFLNRADFRIFPVGSNEEALKIHRSEKADIIIADLDSQALSGELFCSTIRDNEELCRVSLIIMHSGAASEIQRASRCRANAFMEKLTDPAILIEKACKLMSIPAREAYRSPIGIMVNCDNTRHPALGYAENISVTGMLFDSEKSFSMGETISCWFVLPDSTHVNTVAEIVRVINRVTEHDTNQYGIRFLGLAPAFRAAISDYVRKKQQRR